MGHRHQLHRVWGDPHPHAQPSSQSLVGVGASPNPKQEVPTPFPKEREVCPGSVTSPTHKAKRQAKEFLSGLGRPLYPPSLLRAAS